MDTPDFDFVDWFEKKYPGFSVTDTDIVKIGTHNKFSLRTLFEMMLIHNMTFEYYMEMFADMCEFSGDNVEL